MWRFEAYGKGFCLLSCLLFSRLSLGMKCEKLSELSFPNTSGAFITLRGLEEDSSGNILMYGDGWMEPEPTYGILRKFGPDIQNPDDGFGQHGIFKVEPPKGMSTQIIDAHRFRDMTVLVGILSENTREMRPRKQQIFVSLLDAQGRAVAPYGSNELFTIGNNQSILEPAASVMTDEGNLIIAADAKDSAGETLLFYLPLLSGGVLRSVTLSNSLKGLEIQRMVDVGQGSGRTQLVIAGTDAVRNDKYFGGLAHRSLIMNVILDAEGKLERSMARLLPFDPRFRVDQQSAHGEFGSEPQSLVQVSPGKFLMLASLSIPNTGNSPENKSLPGYVIAMLNRDGTLDTSFGDQGRLFLNDEFHGGHAYAEIAEPAHGYLPLTGWKDDKATLWLLCLADGSLRQVDQFRKGLNPATLLRRRNSRGEEELLVGTHLYARDTYTKKMPVITTRSYVLQP